MAPHEYARSTSQSRALLQLKPVQILGRCPSPVGSIDRVCYNALLGEFRILCFLCSRRSSAIDGRRLTEHRMRPVEMDWSCVKSSFFSVSNLPMFVLVVIAWILDALTIFATFVRRIFKSKHVVPEKKPDHIAFVFTNAYEISVDVLTEIVHQCAINKICQVSFYDPFSICTSHVQQLSKSVNFLWEHLDHEHPSKSLPTVIFDRTSRELDMKRITGSASESLRVTLLGNEDGRSSLVEICRDISIESSSSSDSISAASISEKLKARQLCEPDLVVIVGTLSTFAGFPPWSLRVAEVHHVATLTPMAEDLFSAFLETFAIRDRRLGR
uniref:ditrans,polycis-polyprenyl diphosphate synthase [(2E,6E)-farnesyldiphosphate specific] n=1 Tax=Steinernema glaseri TaxID=37863 RepID=A0A1I7YX35_9BILA